jgi:hypothetical protein
MFSAFYIYSLCSLFVFFLLLPLSRSSEGFLVSKKILLSFSLFCLHLFFFFCFFPLQVSRGSVYKVYTQLLLGKIQCINLGCKSQLICSQIIKMRKLQYCHWLCADSSDFFPINSSSQPSMLGIKSQPLDDGEVLLFMAFCSCQKLLFPMNYSCTKTWFSLFGVVEILSFMMIQPPSPAFNILLQFNPSF